MTKVSTDARKRETRWHKSNYQITSPSTHSNAKQSPWPGPHCNGGIGQSSIAPATVEHQAHWTHDCCRQHSNCWQQRSQLLLSSARPKDVTCLLAYDILHRVPAPTAALACTLRLSGVVLVGTDWPCLQHSRLWQVLIVEWQARACLLSCESRVLAHHSRPPQAIYSTALELGPIQQRNSSSSTGAEQMHPFLSRAFAHDCFAHLAVTVCRIYFSLLIYITLHLCRCCESERYPQRSCLLVSPQRPSTIHTYRGAAKHFPIRHVTGYATRWHAALGTGGIRHADASYDRQYLRIYKCFANPRLPSIPTTHQSSTPAATAPMVCNATSTSRLAQSLTPSLYRSDIRR